MTTRFNEAKATQVAALLLKHRGTGRMKYLKLIKLMYLVDREALARWGRTVTTDRPVSMDNGPVLSQVFNLIAEEQTEPGIWSEHIVKSADWDVELAADPGDEELSLAEVQLIADVFAAHGHKNRWQIVKEVHEFAEWHDPDGSMIPINTREILRAVGKQPAEIAAIEEEAETEALAAELFQPVSAA